MLSSLQSRNAHRQAPAFMVQLKVKLITPADSPYPAVLHGLSSGLRHFDFPLIKIAEQKGDIEMWDFEEKGRQDEAKK